MKGPPFGNQVIEYIRSIASYNFDYALQGTESGYKLSIDIKLESPEVKKEAKTSYALVVAHSEETSSKLLEYKSIKGMHDAKHTVAFPLSVTGQITISLLCKKFIGLDQCAAIEDVEKAVGKKCACKRSLSLSELDLKEIEDLLASPDSKHIDYKPCNHKCKNKKMCKHMCCKHAIDNTRQSTLNDFLVAKKNDTSFSSNSDIAPSNESLVKSVDENGAEEWEDSISNEELEAIAATESSSSPDNFFEQLIANNP